MNANAVHVAALKDYLNKDDMSILDIGSGTGEIPRAMSESGARVVGLECSSSKMEQALAGDKESVRYIYGVGQAMPFRDACFEVAVFFNSLHHIPAAEMSGALAEAARVVKSGGMVYVAEPLAEGSCFKLDALVEDETEVRAKAFQALRSASAMIPNLKFTGEGYYETPFCYQDFEEYKNEWLRFDNSRRELIGKLEPEIRKRFEELGITDDKGTNFIQPMRTHRFSVRS